MAKSKIIPDKKLKKANKNSILDEISKTEEEHLEVLIKYSKMAITEHGTYIDKFFEDQVTKLEKELSTLRGKNEKK